jgi:hypothetical protein
MRSHSLPAGAFNRARGFAVVLSLSVWFAGCFSDPKVDVSAIQHCKTNDNCPSGYVCAVNGTCCPSTTGLTCSAMDASVQVEVGGGPGMDAGNPIDSSALLDGAKDAAGTILDGHWDVAIDGPAVAPDVPLQDLGASEMPADQGTPDVPATTGDANTPDAPDTNTNCPAPRVACNGQCIDPPPNGCCLATDCSGTCMSCGADHICTAAKSQDDPSHHCAGTCDATGACKTKQGQACVAAGDCATGICADGYCCDNACTGSCQACNVSTSPGTCTILAPDAVPNSGHPPCTGTDVCAGKCSGSPDCTFPTSTTACGTASCSSSNVYQGTGTCNAGTCSLPSPKTCTNSACSVTAAGGCTGACKPGDLGCGSNTMPQLCDANGTWQNQSACLTGFTCTGSGSCTCAAGKTACPTACTDLQSDSGNCGTCGHDCLGGTCVSGACQPVGITGTLSTPPQVFGVDSQYVYYLVASPTTNLALDAYRVSKTAVGATPSFVATSMVMGDFAGVIGSTLFQYDSGGAQSDMTIGSTFGYTPLALAAAGNWLALWRSVQPRYYAQINADHSSIYSVGWYDLGNALIATHSESTTGIAPVGGSVSYGAPPYAGGDSVYWVRTVSDSSFTPISSALFTASVSNTTAIQMANSTSGSALNITDVNSQSVLLSDGYNELFRVGLPATSSTASPLYVTTIGSVNAVEGAQGIYFIDDAYSLYRCSPGNCLPTKARLATDQPTQVQAHISSTLFQDDTALYWGRSSSVTGTGANQIMRLAK